MQITESGNNEWYTPMEYVDSARIVMGAIDLDPASNDFAQANIKAKTYYTASNCGLSKDWEGRVWLNPPYSRKLLNKFVDKLINEEGVSEYICLVNSSTDTKWCHSLMNNAELMCLTKGRISFLNQQGLKVKGNSRGQIFFYKGNNGKTFEEEFGKYGKIVDLKKIHNEKSKEM